MPIPVNYDSMVKSLDSIPIAIEMLTRAKAVLPVKMQFVWLKISGCSHNAISLELEFQGDNGGNKTNCLTIDDAIDILNAWSI